MKLRPLQLNHLDCTQAFSAEGQPAVVGAGGGLMLFLSCSLGCVLAA